MFNKKIIVLSFLFTLGWVACAYAEIKEGLWEITTKIEMKNTQMRVPTNTVRQCITKENPVPQPIAKGYKCEITDTEINGDIVLYLVECTTKNSAMIIIGETIYKENTLKGTSTTTVKTLGQSDVQINNEISGKYIGPCKK